jgi:hypothetical protein
MDALNLSQAGDAPPALPARTWFDVCAPILWGLGFAAEAAERLVPENSLASFALGLASLAWWGWLLWMVWHPKRGLPSATFCILLLLILAAPYHYFLSTHVWGAPILALLIGVHFRLDARAAKRPNPMPMLACMFLGVMSLNSPLSNLQRCQYLIVGIGIVFALRSAILGTRPTPERRSVSPPKPDVTLPGGVVRFIKWCFGKIEYVQVSSPRMEDRVRKKYGSAIAELTRLGFEPECCYGETFGMVRLLRVVPAITTVGMWFDGQPWKIHERTKIMAC